MSSVLTTMPPMSEQMMDAVQLLVVGMGFVFIFLAMLIVVIHLLAKFTPPDAEPTPAKAAARPALANSNSPNSAVMAAISAAVNHYRKKS